MNSFLSRANAVFAFTLSLLALLTFGCFLSTAFITPTIDNLSLNTGKVLVKNAMDWNVREKNDLGFITFNLQADFSPLFNWNTKMLFLFMCAEYETPTNKLNQVVLWDKIIQRGESAVLDYKSMSTKYYFWDDGAGLKGNKNVTLTLYWNTVPTAGGLPILISSGSHSFKFPSEYQGSSSQM